MRIKILALGLICIFLNSFFIAQEKPIIKKNLKATTEDGRKVLLKIDGTWEFIKEEPKEEWKEVARWKGSAIKNTETFHISSDTWIISWLTEPGKYGDMNFQILIYKANGELVTLAANVIGKNEDYSIMRGKGGYYLTINTAQSYSIVILEKTK